MKRSTFFYVAFRVVFTTFITSNLTLKLAAHDLPSDARSFNQARLAAAHNVESAPIRSPVKLGKRVLPTSSHAICHVADWAVSTASDTLMSGFSNEPWSSVATRIRSSSFSGVAEISIAKPNTEAQQQSKTPSAAMVLAKRPQFDENYLPYDLSMRDWRHREFTTRLNAHIVAGTTEAKPTFATTEEPRSRSRELSNLFLHSLQSQVALLGGQLTKAVAGLTQSLKPVATGRILGLASMKLGSLHQSATERGSALLASYWEPRLQPFFRGPHLVRISLPDGQPLLVSLEVARSLGMVHRTAPGLPRSKDSHPRHLLNTQVAKHVTRFFTDLGNNYRACFDTTMEKVALALDLNQVQRVASSQGPVR